jgi:hypothetical protein
MRNMNVGKQMGEAVTDRNGSKAEEESCTGKLKIL